MIREVLSYILTIAGTVLLVILAMAAYELARTLKKARQTIVDLGNQAGELTASANEAIEQVQPIITKVDGMVSDLEPAVAEVQPLIEKASTVIEVATVDLASVNDILVDVSSVTDTASNVTSTVSQAANSAVSGVAGVVGKFTGAKSNRQRKLIGRSRSAAKSEPQPEATDEGSQELAQAEQPSHKYVTYGSTSDGE